MHISRPLLFRLILFVSFLSTFLWLNSLTIIGSNVWEAHLEGLSPLLELPIHASPWLCLLIGFLTVCGRLPIRYAVLMLGLFILLAFTILRLWYVPHNPDMKRSLKSPNQAMQRTLRARHKTCYSPTTLPMKSDFDHSDSSGRSCAVPYASLIFVSLGQLSASSLNFDFFIVGFFQVARPNIHPCLRTDSTGHGDLFQFPCICGRFAKYIRVREVYRPLLAVRSFVYLS